MKVEIIFTIIILCLAVICMSIGIIFNNKPLSGSCGGIETNGLCTICGGNENKCENKNLDLTNF